MNEKPSLNRVEEAAEAVVAEQLHLAVVGAEEAAAAEQAPVAAAPPRPPTAS